MLKDLFLLALGACSLCLTAVACTSLWWMLYAWRRPETPNEGAGLGPVPDPRLRFSLIVPARHEERVLGHTLHRLLELDHPNVEILVVVGDDDEGTLRVARAASESLPDRVRILIDRGHPKNKPKALNTALPACTGDIVAVFDAEDDVHPAILRHVEAWFRRTDAEVVQGAVQLMDYRSNWYSPRAVLEYFFWFRSKLRFQARWRFVPLGGNTIFIRRSLLEGVRGWDPESLTEDCDLGARLSILSARVAVVTLPQLATQEEVPPNVGALFRQRARWNQGFLQVLRKGDWRHLPLRAERFLAAYTLVMPFLQALVALSLPAAVAGVLLLKVPTTLALLTFVPGLITLVTLVVESAGIREFCKVYALPCRWHDHARLILGTVPYQGLLSSAALWAVVREIRGHRDWAKTPHRGVLQLGLRRREYLPIRSGPVFPGRAMRGTWSLQVDPVPIAPPARLWWKPLIYPTHAARAVGWTRAWVRAHARSIVVVTGLLTIVGIAHAWGLSRSPGFGDDEGTYAAQAWAVLKLHRLSFYTYWYDHPPLGWLLLAGWAWLTRSFSRYGVTVLAGREAVLVCHLASCGLLYVLARRLGFRRGWAAAAVLMYAFSPVGFSLHRMVFLDNIATPFLIASFVLVLSPDRRMVAHAGGAACFAMAVLVKETSLLMLPALALQMWSATDPRTRRFSLALSGSLFLVVGGLYPLYAALKGELFPGSGHVSLVGSVVWQLFERASSGSLLSPSSGARSIVRWWLSLDPWLLIASFSLIPATVLVKRLRPCALALLALFAALLRPGYLPAMQVILILPFAALLTAGILDSLSSYVARNGSPQRRASEWAGSGSRRPLRRLTLASAWLVLVVVVGGSVPVAAAWGRRDAELMSSNQNAAYDEASAWIFANVPTDATMLVDSVFWLDLVERGFHPVSVVWFYKLDLDPGIAKRFPHGWRDFDYVVASPVVRNVSPSLRTLVQVRQALEHSFVVATFGSGDERIEIRKVESPSAP